MSRRLGGPPGEVFLSHSSKDGRFACRLAEVLRAHGVPVWYSVTHLSGAQQWHDEIGVALKRCDWFLLIMSPSAVRSDWVKRELLYALDRPQYREPITPLKYRTCKPGRLTWTIGSIQAVDFMKDFHRGCASPMRSWGMDYNRAKAIPAKVYSAARSKIRK